MAKIVVVGSGTDVGKTIVSATLVAGLGAHYWKPIQAGTTPQTDSERVQQLLGLPPQRIVPEAYRLLSPESPHSAAAKEGIVIAADKIQVPDIEGHLVIEGAGGLMVPLNHSTLYIDLLHQWQIPVVLVCSLYLGAINHTLLSLHALKSHNIPTLGLIFSGQGSPSMEEAILRHSGVPLIGRVPQLDHLDATSLQNAFSGLDLEQLLMDI
jgi:dethiobiotin synthetase